MNDDIKMILRDSRMWGEAPEAMRRLEAELKQATDQWTTWSQVYQEAKVENERLREEKRVLAENETWAQTEVEKLREEK